MSVSLREAAETRYTGQMDTVAGSPKHMVSEHDREHFRKIGRWKHEGHGEALKRHMARSGNERLAYSVLMNRRYERLPTWSQRQDDPSPFYERAKELGFYRP